MHVASLRPQSALAQYRSSRVPNQDRNIITLMSYVHLVAYGIQWHIAPNGKDNVGIGNAMSMLSHRKHLPPLRAHAPMHLYSHDAPDVKLWVIFLQDSVGA